MPRRPTIYRRVSSLCHVRRHSTITHLLHTLPGVVAPVTCQRPGTEATLPRIVQQHGYSVTFRRARRAAHHEVHQQPVAVLHQRVGRPRLPLADMAYAAAMKVYTGFSARRFNCDVQAAYRQGITNAAPSFNSVNRYIADPDMTPIITDMISVWSMGQLKPGKKGITGKGQLGHAFPRISPDEVPLFNRLEIQRIEGSFSETIEKFNRRMDPMSMQVHFEVVKDPTHPDPSP